MKTLPPCGEVVELYLMLKSLRRAGVYKYFLLKQEVEETSLGMTGIVRINIVEVLKRELTNVNCNPYLDVTVSLLFHHYD